VVTWAAAPARLRPLQQRQQAWCAPLAANSENADTTTSAGAIPPLGQLLPRTVPPPPLPKPVQDNTISQSAGRPHIFFSFLGLFLLVVTFAKQSYAHAARGLLTHIETIGQQLECIQRGRCAALRGVTAVLSIDHVGGVVLADGHD
jgi:hypothetical protein